METFTIVALVGLVIGLGAFAYNWKKKQGAKKNVITPPASLPDAKLPKPRTAKAPK
jgi:hypothetical protein